MKVNCRECGTTIAAFSADTRRKTSEKLKEAVCEDCLNPQIKIVEQLADLEHRQWIHWSKYVAENHDIPDKLEEKWEKSWKPYSELSEEMKEKDRKWARKVLEILSSKSDEVDQ